MYNFNAVLISHILALRSASLASERCHTYEKNQIEASIATIVILTISSTKVNAYLLVFVLFFVCTIIYNDVKR